MKINDMYPSKYLRGADLKAPVNVIIETVKTETVYHPGEGQTSVYVLYCEKATKGVILTRPLAQGIAQALGVDDTDRWTGRQVVLYPQPMTVAGRAVVAIRARAVNGDNHKPPDPEPEAEEELGNDNF